MIPLGTRSARYLTNLLQPTSDLKNSEDSFSWEFQLARVEQENNTTLTDHVNVAETPEPLQHQHLQLLAKARQTYNDIKATGTDYITEIVAVSNMQAVQEAPSSSGTSYARKFAPIRKEQVTEGARRAEA